MRTRAIMAVKSYKKMYGVKETCSNISVQMSLRVSGAGLENDKYCVTFASGLKTAHLK